jgi:hypothetical protein
MESEMTIEELKPYAEKYFSEVIKCMIETPECSAEYDSHVEDLEAMSEKMDEQSFGYLKLKVVY